MRAIIDFYARTASKAILLCGVALGLWGAAVPAEAQVTGVSYTAAPTGTRVNFRSGAGLEDGYLYGGRLGFSFGEYVELGALYLTNGNLATDFTDLDFIGDEAAEAGNLDARDVRVQRYGGEVKFNLSRGVARPFLTAGAGILRFDPEVLDAARTIYVGAGAGLQYVVAERYALFGAVENLTYRLNPAASLMSSADREASGIRPEDVDDLQNTLGARVGVQFYLGGRPDGDLTELDLALRDQLSGGLRGLSLAVEPFYGRVRFDDAMGFRSGQQMAGVSAGFDLGPYVGLRGFYWRGVGEEGTFDFESLQAYGGEMRLSFGSEVRNLTPYLSFGAGYFDVGSDYRGSGATLPEDQPFATGGAGVVVPLGNTLRLNGDVRALLTSTDTPEDVSDPANVYASLMYSVGLNFNLGRRSPSAGRLVEERLASDRQRALDRDVQLERKLAEAEARIDELVSAVQRAQEGDSLALEQLAVLRTDSLPSARAVQGAPGETALPASRPSSSVSDRTMTLPIPESGEVYLRFGSETAPAGTGSPNLLVQQATPFPALAPAGSGAGGAADALTAEAIQRLVREAMQAELSRMQVGELSALELQRVLSRMDAMEARMNRRMDRLQDAPQPPRVLVQAGPSQAVVQEVPTWRRGPFGQRLTGLMPVFGVRAGRGPEQALIGLRAEFRSSSRFRLIPEFTYGFGDGTSFGIVGSAATSFGENWFYPVRPYAGAGVGLLSERGFSGLGLALNVLAGAEYPFGPGALFGEFSTLDFFDYDRILFGYRLDF